MTLVDGWQCALDRGSCIGDGGASGGGAAGMTGAGAGAGSGELLEHACQMCDARFASRNQMFKHLRAVHAPPGDPDNTQPRGANGDGGRGSSGGGGGGAVGSLRSAESGSTVDEDKLERTCLWQLRTKQGSDPDAAAAAAAAAAGTTGGGGDSGDGGGGTTNEKYVEKTRALGGVPVRHLACDGKVRLKLQALMRARRMKLEPNSSPWWTAAIALLHTFLQQRPALFRLTAAEEEETKTVGVSGGDTGGESGGAVGVDGETKSAGGGAAADGGGGAMVVTAR